MLIGQGVPDHLQRGLDAGAIDVEMGAGADAIAAVGGQHDALATEPVGELAGGVAGA